VGAGSREALSTLVTPGAPGPEQQDAPLTEAERKLLVRLLSDPTYFPIEFRTWIRTYLEGSDIRLPSSAIVGGNAPKVNLPAGVILPFAGGVIPSNCLHCNGQAIVRADYELLFQAIGTTWGVGNGTSTFNIPDLRDRALYGAGNVVGFAATDGRAAGSRGGPFHHHPFSGTTDNAGYHGHGMDGAGWHSHSVSGGTDGAGNHSHLTRDDGTPTGAQGGSPTGASGTARYTVQDPRYYTNSDGSHSHGISGSTSGDGDHSHGVHGEGEHGHNFSGDTAGGYDDKPSYAGINYIIATGKNV
jgi:microcystin-dependent protein